MNKLHNFSFETGTIFIDSFKRVWEYKKAWDSERTGYLVGVTRDTPTFTYEQMLGISIEGFRQIEKGDREYADALNSARTVQRVVALGEQAGC